MRRQRFGWREFAHLAAYEGPMTLLALRYFAGILLLLGRERWMALLARAAPM